MLSYLEIKNFVLIDHAKLDLTSGLNIISGESGSGKSLLLKALRALLGEKNNLEWIKPGKDFCEVSAVFNNLNKNLVSVLKELEIPLETELTIRRTISKVSTSKIFINDTLISVSKLQEIGEYLGDFVSQHQNQKLVKNRYQLEIVDSFSKDEILFKKLEELLVDKKKQLEIKTDLLAKSRFKDSTLNLLDSQIKEIQNAKLRPEDFEFMLQIEEIKEKIKNRQQYDELYQLCYNDNGLVSLISKIQRKSSSLKLDQKVKEDIESAQNIINDISDVFHKLVSDTEEVPLSEERISVIKKIQNRYGETFSLVKEKLQQLKQEVSQLNNLDEELVLLDENLKKIEKDCEIVCEKISTIRKSNSQKLEKQITTNLQSLEMKGSLFEIVFEKAPISSNGSDKVIFTLSSNKGQKNRPINEIASGGELSRLTLAIYLSLANFDHSFLVFDEIDAGVGGHTAFSIGAKLKDLSKKQQVLCITHLAQIAAYNNQIIKVTKDNTKKEAITEITSIQDKDNILLEISRMLGDSSQKGLELAKELVNKVK